MKALLASLWTDPKVALGLASLLATSVGLILTTGPVSVPIAVGTVLLNVAGGGFLLHADSPWKPARPEALTPPPLPPGPDLK